METLSNNIIPPNKLPIKAIQFGEGNFLRAFVDYMIDISNCQGNTNIGIAVIKPISFGNLKRFNAQDNLYTVMLRGQANGEVVDQSHVVTSIQKAVDPFEDLAEYENLALLDELEFVFSNTTEAGIVFDETDEISLPLPKTFPGKLTKLLYNRYKHFSGAKDKGLVIIPCELIERNGDNLKDCVLKLAKLWDLEPAFAEWINNSNIFCNTLVDRIVTGYPASDAQEIFLRLGYEDNLLVAAEPFGLWVIESEKDISDRLPLNKSGQPVLFTDDQTPYRERKVRILNGGHTTMVPAAYLAGQDIVRNCMKDSSIRKLLENTLYNEIIPTLTLPKQELADFSRSVIERFENPFIDHALLAISLNSVSKWKARVLPSFKDYVKNEGKLPELISFSLAGLIAFYNGSKIVDGALIGHRGDEEYKIIDDMFVLEFFRDNSLLPADKLAYSVLSNADFWGEDLTEFDGFADQVSFYLQSIRNNGAKKAIDLLLESIGE